MKHFVGIDLGSTTTKAVVLDEEAQILGRGITNSRSNYKVACDVAVGEARIDARFNLVAAELEGTPVDDTTRSRLLTELELGYREEQYREQLRILTAAIDRLQGRMLAPRLDGPTRTILDAMEAETSGLYQQGARRKSDFFRDLAGSRYMSFAERTAEETGTNFDQLAGLFDKAILEVENQPPGEHGFRDQARSALRHVRDAPPDLAEAVDRAGAVALDEGAVVGTGYGRQTLPFPKEQIRSEILCHGLGAHKMFPETRTVLDIGGQDTKAIQVDGKGIVSSFQMNDRCAAGCGRYLGYIADEMNLGVHELGPMACESSRPVRINSTCTVFAGAELRERLSLGERREDILAGLHRAIILRAMSLLARSGGVSDEFTFTGGVARNPAAVGALETLVGENYGRVTMNISPDSIYTGALGAALFARHDAMRASADDATGA